MKIYTAENCGELLKRSNFDDAEAAETVRKIVDDVRRCGDEAIFGYEEKFDGTRLTKDTFRVSEEEFSKAYAAIEPDLLSSLRRAKERILEYHSRGRRKETSARTKRAGRRVTYCVRWSARAFMFPAALRRCFLRF